MILGLGVTIGTTQSQVNALQQDMISRTAERYTQTDAKKDNKLVDVKLGHLERRLRLVETQTNRILNSQRSTTDSLAKLVVVIEKQSELIEDLKNNGN
jgi:hypothetical protein